MSDESIKHPTTTGNSSFSRLNYFNNPKFEVKLSRNCLKPGKVILYITFEIKSWSFYIDNVFVLRNSLFGTARFTKNADPNKYPYSGYGVSIHVLGIFLLPNGGFGKNVVIFGTGIRYSSLHVDHEKRMSEFLVTVLHKG